MKIQYKEIQFRGKSLALISEINDIINLYKSQGYDLTLRQVYYQLVAGGIIENNERSYKNVGNLVNDGRLAGLIDWDAIVDRTRNIRRKPHWGAPEEIIESSANQFNLDLWAGQENYVEVWVEKDALIGIISQICSKRDIPHFSCRGYVSQSEMWSGAQRLAEQARYRDVHILHLGDHDPSGLDMTRDMGERLELFGADVQIHRLALNWDQIEEFNPPPNPAKLTDSRAKGYIARHGTSSWELDALKPETLSRIINGAVDKLIDQSAYDRRLREQNEGRELLHKVADHWPEVEETVSNL